METPDPDEVREPLEARAEASSESTEARAHLDAAYAYEAQDQFEDALRECDWAIGYAPELAEAHNLRGVILEELGRKQEALYAYQQSLRLDASSQDAQKNLRELQAEMAEGRRASSLPEGKRFGVRLGAHVIDMIAIYVLTFVTSFVVAILLAVALGVSGRPFYIEEESSQCLSIALGLVTSALYFALFEWLHGASLGKLLLKMRVVMVDGGRCTLGAALIRAVLRYIDGILFGLPAYATMKAPLYQRIGDKSARTMVVDLRDPINRQPRGWRWFLLALVIYLAVNTAVSFGLLMASIRML